MRAAGMNTQDQIPVIPDTVATIVTTAASAVVAQDYPSGAHLMEINAGSTRQIYFNFSSTQAHIPAASISGTSSSSGVQAIVSGGKPLRFQIPDDSTGYSVISASTGIATVCFWRK